MVHAFMIQASGCGIYFDPELNGVDTVVHNVFDAFVLCAMKFHRIVKAQRGRNPGQKQMQCTVEMLALLAHGEVLKAGAGKVRKGGAWKVLALEAVRWLAVSAFVQVLRRKQAKYREALEWLSAAEKAGWKMGLGRRLDLRAFEGYRY